MARRCGCSQLNGTFASIREQPAISQFAKKDVLIHFASLVASLLAHWCSVLSAGPAMSEEEEFYSRWASLPVFSGGWLVPKVTGEDEVPFMPTASYTPRDGVTAARGFLHRMIEMTDTPRGRQSVRLTDAGKALYSAFQVAARARRDHSAKPDFEVGRLSHAML